MATIRERPRKSGGITYTVLWRAGGGRKGKQESERFLDLKKAEVFRGLVEMQGHQWPPGWVRGVGFAAAEPVKLEDMPLMDWAIRVVSRLTGIEERTRKDYRRELENHVDGILVHTDLSGVVSEPTVGNITRDDITDWVRAEETGEVSPEDPDEWLRAKASPKSIKNRHGILYTVFQAAVEASPPLRVDNPCSKTKLPRQDAGTEDEMTFLEHDEWQRIRAELVALGDPVAVDMAEVLVGTGLRWGELAALKVKDLSLSGSQPTLRVQRAWKRQEDNSVKLGPPKTKRSRRTLGLNPSIVAVLRRNIVAKGPDAFVFTTSLRNPWMHANFYNRRWLPAVRAAQEKGLQKAPRLHDLRHTHVAWLIADKIHPAAIQARLGHESITTTMDRYGHLVRQHDAEIAAAVESALGHDAGGDHLRLVAG